MEERGLPFRGGGGGGDDTAGRRGGEAGGRSGESRGVPLAKPRVRAKRAGEDGQSRRRHRSRNDVDEDDGDPSSPSWLPSTPTVRRRSSHRESASLTAVAAAAKSLYHERRGSLRATLASSKGSFRRLLQQNQTQRHNSSRTPTTTAASSVGGSVDSLASRAASTGTNNSANIAATAFYDPLAAGKRGLIEDALRRAAAAPVAGHDVGHAECASLPVSPTKKTFSDGDSHGQLRPPPHGHRRADSLRSKTPPRDGCGGSPRRHRRGARRRQGSQHQGRHPRRHTTDSITPAEVVTALTLSGVTDDLKARLLGDVGGEGAAKKCASPLMPRADMARKNSAVATTGDDFVVPRKRPTSPGSDGSNADVIVPIKKVDFDQEYDIVQKIGEGWFSRIYLTEHRQTRQELVLKAINSKSVSVEDFMREYRYATLLSPHRHCLTVLGDAKVFQAKGYYMFATEYAPFGDLASALGDGDGVGVGGVGIGEQCAKRVARQAALALEWVHSRGLAHRHVRPDNVLVFKSDFSWVKLGDFGAVRQLGEEEDGRRSEGDAYCPPELSAKTKCRVERSQDVFQLGVVVFCCVFGAAPWQRAGDAADPAYAEFAAWRSKRPGARTPPAFKPLTSRGQKLFRKLLDVDAAKRLALSEVAKYADDRWLKKGAATSLLSASINRDAAHAASNDNDAAAGAGARFLSDGVSQLTMGSFRSVHSNAAEKNRVLFTLLQHGVETTVDRSQKNSRIINWIRQGRPDGGGEDDDEDDVDEGDNNNGAGEEEVDPRGNVTEDLLDANLSQCQN